MLEITPVQFRATGIPDLVSSFRRARDHIGCLIDNAGCVPPHSPLSKDGARASRRERGMKVTNTFWVSHAPQVVWPLLNDIERIAPCLPGATLLEVREDGSYVGRVGVRLGPVALSFKGQVAYDSRDDAAMSARVLASGNEERARGTARAKVDFSGSAERDGTRVIVDTDLTLAGSIAQYARGVSMIEATAQLLIDDFAKNLEELLQSADAKTAGAELASTEEPTPQVAAAPASTPVREISGLTLLWRLLMRWLGLGRGRSA